MGSQQFRLRIGQWANQTDAKIEALARQVCQAMAERAIDNTPVDTGALRGYWQPSLNKEVVGSGDPDPTGGKAKAKIAAVIADLKLGDRFVMTNGAEYALRVEYGFVGEDSLGRTFDQAGQHYVSDAVKAFPAILAETAASLGMKVR